MRIDTCVDLTSAWKCATVLGKILFVPLIAVAFAVVCIASMYTTLVVEFGCWAGFLIVDESKED